MFKFVPAPLFKTKTVTSTYTDVSYDLDIRFRYLRNNKGQRIACLATIRNGEKIFWGISRQNPKLGENRQLMMIVAEGRALKAFSQNEEPNVVLVCSNCHHSGLRGWTKVEDIKTILEYFENEDYKS